MNETDPWAYTSIRIRTDLQLKLRLSLDHICRNVYHNTTPEMSRRPSRGGGNLIAKNKYSAKNNIFFLVTLFYIGSPSIF